MVDCDVKLEAVSALLGSSIQRNRNGFPHGKVNKQPFTVDDFLITAVLGKETFTAYLAPNGSKDLQALPVHQASWNGGNASASNSTHRARDGGTSWDGGNTSGGSTVPHPISASLEQYFIDEDEFFEPAFDCDFTDIVSSTCERGGEPYQRPCGWYRFALKVWDKYPGGNAWLGGLGSDGWRNESVPGEWPVSYHGTSLDGAKGIMSSHYKVGDREKYGRGIYSTPDIDVAADSAFSQTFKSKKTGVTYKVVMQNRINPRVRKIIKADTKTWLIPVPVRNVYDERRVVERSIRPYGILIKEVK